MAVEAIGDNLESRRRSARLWSERAACAGGCGYMKGAVSDRDTSYSDLLSALELRKGLGKLSSQ